MTDNEIKGRVEAIIKERLTEAWNDGFRSAVRQMNTGLTVDDMVELAASLKDKE